ncbi:YceD family protein [Sphingomonas sp. R86520]|uniref:YceD family protein n=1 Tax=Sphingomonas sp. R86520 TaxID=3093859 RepID=UPI0036D32FEB
MKPEFSRPERLDTIGERERIVEIVATEDERAALAKRFAMVSISHLDARFAIKRTDSGIVVKGRVTGAAVQPCSVTDEPLDTQIDEPVALLFVEQLIAEGDEVELSDDALDMVAIEGGTIDLGEAAADTLALSIDPFPRGPNAAAALAAAGVISEDEFRPANAFSDLKARMAGKS